MFAECLMDRRFYFDMTRLTMHSANQMLTYLPNSAIAVAWFEHRKHKATDPPVDLEHLNRYLLRQLWSLASMNPSAPNLNDKRNV